MSKHHIKQRRHSQLGLFDSVSLAAGIIVGVSIYKVSPSVFSNVTAAWHGLAAWLAGGALSLIGALCVAELAAAYPRSGGQYIYLNRAYGPWMGFLFGWAQLFPVITGTIGAMAYVFADYAVECLDISPIHGPMLAAEAVTALTALNLLGVVVGKTAQNILTIAKVLGLGGIVAAGLLSSETPRSIAIHPPSTGAGGIGLAMIMILYAYGGWSDVAYVASESRRRRRNIPLALILGVAVVTLLYMAINIAYLAGLGLDGLRMSAAPAADVLIVVLGPFGGKVMSVLVMISALGAINGMIFAGARVYAAMGQDHPQFGLLARWSHRQRSPIWSLSIQGFVSVALIAIVGSDAGRSIVDKAHGWVGLAPPQWEKYGGGFEALVIGPAPIFWLFFLLTGAAVYILRWREPARRRPFRVPLYPITPLIFCGTSLYMLYAAVAYAGTLALLGVVPLALGMSLYLVSQKARDK